MAEVDEERRSRDNMCKSVEAQKDAACLRKASHGWRGSEADGQLGASSYASRIHFFGLHLMDAASRSVLLLQFALSMQSWSKVPQPRLFKLG